MDNQNFKRDEIRILIVEDDDEDVLIITNLIRDGLKKNPRPIIDRSVSFEQTLTFLQTNTYDLCLFDYRLGQFDGIHLLSAVREKGYDVPVIFLTAQGDQEVAVEAMKAGAIDYLAKNKLTAEILSYSIRYGIQLTREAERRKQAEIDLKKSNEDLRASLQKLQSAQNQIMRSEKLAGIGRLAAGICHEILNPLNIISGHVQAILLERGTEASLCDDMNSIIEEIHRVEKIISGLLRFSRKEGTEFRFADINQEIESTLAIVEREMVLENIQVIRKYQDDLPQTCVDTDRMRQVYLNIINNAKYALIQKRGGTITVSTQLIFRCQKKRRKTDFTVEPLTSETRGEPFIRIQFSDTGSGIKKDHLDKIFEPFFTTKPEDKGTGLGLAVCHTIVEKHWGTLEVESDYGKGAVFTIELPVDEQERLCDAEKAPED
jgi:signal transduction histidine kinase